MSESHTYVVVLGGGSGGYSAALRAAELGKSVTVIERDKLGGTCLHLGCIPTKAMLHAGEIADNARTSAAFGVDATFDKIDMVGAHAYKDGVVDKNYRGLDGLVRSSGIALVTGEGRMTGQHPVQVGSKTYSGTNLILATGSTSRTLPGLEIDGERVITSDHGLQLDRVPESVIVLGGGVIGCEFASTWTSFGAKVTIIEATSHLVPAEDEANSRQLERAFRRRGIDLLLDARSAAVHLDDEGVRVTLEDGRDLPAELMLVAVGRAPSSAGVGYKDHGVRIERCYVATDEYMRTSVDGVYAVGDLVSVGDSRRILS